MTQFVAKLHALENVHVSFPKWGRGVEIFGGEKNPPWRFHTCHFTYTHICLRPTHLSLKSKKKQHHFLLCNFDKKTFHMRGKKLTNPTMYLGFFKKNYFIYQNDKNEKLYQNDFAKY